MSDLIHSLRFLVLMALLAVQLPVAGAVAAPFRIAADSGAVIVVCPGKYRDLPSYNRRVAADELSAYLQRVTGVKVPVTEKISAERIAAGGAIFVGRSTYTDALDLGRDRYDFGAGGFLIKTVAGNLYILGHDTVEGARVGSRLFGEVEASGFDGVSGHEHAIAGLLGTS